MPETTLRHCGALTAGDLLGELAVLDEVYDGADGNDKPAWPYLEASLVLGQREAAIELPSWREPATGAQAMPMLHVAFGLLDIMASSDPGDSGRKWSAQAHRLVGWAMPVLDESLREALAPAEALMKREDSPPYWRRQKAAAAEARA